MQYGEQKRRTMMRSILPSCARKSAKEDKNHINRQRRARIRHDLNQVWDLESAEAWDADWLHKDLDAEMSYVVWERRSADKLNHFVRWAEAITADCEDGQDRLDYMRSILPNNLIGRHAESHLPRDWDPNFRYLVPPHWVDLGYATFDEWKTAERRARKAELADFIRRTFSNRKAFEEFADHFYQNVVGYHVRSVRVPESEHWMDEDYVPEPIKKIESCSWCNFVIPRDDPDHFIKRCHSEHGRLHNWHRAVGAFWYQKELKDQEPRPFAYLLTGVSPARGW